MKYRLSALILAAALVLLCASCGPAAEEASAPIPSLEVTPTAALPPTPGPTSDPSPALTGLAEELCAVVEDYFSLKRDAVNGVELPAELADTGQGRDAIARAEVMRAFHRERGTHIVSIETELRDFIVRWTQGSSAMVSVYQWTWVNYNGTGADQPATDKMGWGYPHDVTLEQNGSGVYEVVRDRSGEYEETGYESELCQVSTNYDWLGEGYACTSEALGIRVEFPPEWDACFTFEEEEVEGLLQSGGSGQVINLVSLSGDREYGTTFARIYWVPKGEEGAGTDSEELVTLWASDEGAYVCEIRQLDLDPNPGAGDPHPDYEAIRAAYETVRDGILNREWELDVLGQ